MKFSAQNFMLQAKELRSSLTKLEIPNLSQILNREELTQVFWRCLAECTSLKELTLQAPNLHTISQAQLQMLNQALAKCTQLQRVNFNNKGILKRIGFNGAHTDLPFYWSLRSSGVMHKMHGSVGRYMPYSGQSFKRINPLLFRYSIKPKANVDCESTETLTDDLLRVLYAYLTRREISMLALASVEPIANNEVKRMRTLSL